jgi:hypothetical protein
MWAVGQDGQLYGRGLSGRSWTRWRSLGRPAQAALSTSARVVPTRTRRGGLVVYGVGADGQLYGRLWTGRMWRPWVALGRPAGAALSTNATILATSDGTGVLRLFALGQDGQVYARTGATGPWVELGRPAASALSTSARITHVSRGRGHLALFALGQDGQLYIRVWTRGGWRPWGAIGQPPQSALSISAPIAATDVGRFHYTVFAVGQDAQLYGRSLTNGTWGPWEAIGRPAEAALSTSAAILVNTANALHQDVFAIGQDGGIYGRSWNAGAWESWGAIGRPAWSALSTTGALVPVPIARGRVALFSIGQDGQLYGVASPARP